jgi:O-antigen ligase
MGSLVKTRYLRKLSHRIPEVLIAGFIMVIPLSPKWSNYLLIVIGIVVLRKFYSEPRVRNRYHLPKHLYFLMVAFLVRVIWLIGSNNLSYGLRTLETEIPLLVIPLLFASVDLSLRSRRLLVDTYILMCLLLMAYSFVILFNYIRVSEYTIWNYWETHFVTAQYYSMLNMLSWSSVSYSFLSMIVLYGFNLIVIRDRRTRVSIVFTGVYVATAFAFIMVAGSLAGLAIMVTSLLAYALFFTYKKIAIKPVGAVAFILFLIAILYVGHLNLRDRLYGIDPQRYQLFSVAWDAWKERPFLGYGTGSQKEIVQNIRIAEQLGFKKEDYPGPLVNHPHNQFLTELLQFGLLGSLPLLLFFGFSFAYAIKNNSPALFVTLLTVACYMMIESPINSNKGLVPFVVLICILSHPGKESAEEPAGG